MLAQTFSGYNALSLDQLDAQLHKMASAADENMSLMFRNIQEDLSYVLSRRGFTQAEAHWEQSGDHQDLLLRMQENLASQNPLVQAMLAIEDGEVILSTDGNTGYFFPAGREGNLVPCFAGDGTMYIALFEETPRLQYAILINTTRWYQELSQFYADDNIRLLLMGSQGKILLHKWMGAAQVTALEDLTQTNCDYQAVRWMLESRNTGRVVNATYNIVYPGSTFVHEMRMTVIPAESSANGYFIVALSSDYDEIIRPMHAAAIKLIIYGSTTVAGFLLMVSAALWMIRQTRQQDQELLHLQEKNDEISSLLAKTQELAHHQRLETIGTLTSSIAHEFNNLLTPIMGYSILILEGLPEECDELADNASEIYEASRKAKTIIARLNELSRKNTETSLHPLLMSRLVRKTLDVAGPAQPAHVTTEIRIEAEDCWVLGNETQLSQLLLNLILNAFHAMESSGGVLTLTLLSEADECILCVADTGAGIPPEALSRIFEPFYTTKESGRGTGLGLAIVQQVTESHHGSIAVESVPGAGTTFTVRFPAVAQPDGDAS